MLGGYIRASRLQIDFKGLCWFLRHVNLTEVIIWGGSLLQVIDLKALRSVLLYIS